MVPIKEFLYTFPRKNSTINSHTPKLQGNYILQNSSTKVFNKSQVEWLKEKCHEFKASQG